VLGPTRSQLNAFAYNNTTMCKESDTNDRDRMLCKESDTNDRDRRLEYEQVAPILCPMKLEAVRSSLKESTVFC
jgi:hypothetical protein